MDGSAVQEIKSLAQLNQVIEVEGETFSPLGYKRVYSDPRPSVLGVHTLSAIRDYLTANVDGVNLEKLIVTVDSHKTVTVQTHVHGEMNDRHEVIQAIFDHVEPFRFGSWMDSETFNIALRSLFVDTDDLNAVVEYVSKIKLEDSAEIEDDGVTQSATVRVGARGNLVERQPAPSIVTLKPFRTFPEVDQPASRFLFRMRRDGKSVQLSLHEADGGAWKNEARNRIAAWLRENLGWNMVILA